jgi:hypothetical protein
MTRRRAAASVAVVVLSAAGWLATCNNSSSPSATPPEPTPHPTAAPEPFGAGKPPCTLPPGKGSGQNCPRQTSSYLPLVERSLDRLVERRPEIFDLNAFSGCHSCYRVKNVAAYTKEMVAEAESEGACAIWDGEELAVKKTNDFNDQYDILTFENFIRRDHGSYRATCSPAWF